MGYRANGLGLELRLGVWYSPIVWCTIKCDPCFERFSWHWRYNECVCCFDALHSL